MATVTSTGIAYVREFMNKKINNLFANEFICRTGAVELLFSVFYFEVMCVAQLFYIMYFYF